MHNNLEHLCSSYVKGSKAADWAFLKLRGKHKMNSGQEIMKIKGKMEKLQNEGGSRNWKERKQLQGTMNKAYRKEEEYWAQKSMIQWLKEEYQNTKFFHVYTAQRSRSNCIERLVSDQEVECRTSGQIEVEITYHY